MSPTIAFLRSQERPRPIRSLRHWLLAALLSFAFGQSVTARTPTEYEVKAAFLVNFTKFVEWPATAFADTNAALVIGIVGQDPFGEALTGMAKTQTIQGRPLEIRRYRFGESYSGCHVLFLSRSEAAHTAEILKAVQPQPILTVSEQDDFLPRGGMINFILVENNVRFDINNRATTRAGLRSSSKLLMVAHAVRN
jgi:hypothetical protein